MYKFKASSRDSDNSSAGFLRNIEDRERELTNNKTIERNYHVTIPLKDVFGCAEHQENCTYGLGYILTLQKIVISMYQVIRQELIKQ